MLRQFEGGPLAPAFAVQLVQRLRDQDPVVTPALHWLEEQLAGQGTTSDEIVRVEHQRQAAMNVTVRNVITSMRLISAFDWSEFFESVSLVDAILWTDTDFAAPDFATRDRYRRAIEELSRCSPHDELEVARRAVSHAKRFRGKVQEGIDPTADRRGDPGYYLISKGRAVFEPELGFRVPLRSWLRRAYMTHAASRYLGTIALVSWPHPRFVPVHFRRSGSGWTRSGATRASRSHPGFGSGDRIGESRSHGTARATGDAQAGAP